MYFTGLYFLVLLSASCLQAGSMFDWFLSLSPLVWFQKKSSPKWKPSEQQKRILEKLEERDQKSTIKIKFDDFADKNTGAIQKESLKNYFAHYHAEWLLNINGRSVNNTFIASVCKKLKSDKVDNKFLKFIPIR